MDQADTVIVGNDAPLDNDEPFRLFNHVYSAHTGSQAPDNGTWSPFPRLPLELRLRIWELFLRQHRMIELEIHYNDNEDNWKSPSYTERNALGNLVSGLGYTLNIQNRGYAASLSPLLWVDSEARQAALSFFRVHLPFRFPRHGGERVLYLSPDYDVLYVQPHGDTEAIIPDLLHDIRAYDPKDQGIAHLAIKGVFPKYEYHDSRPRPVPLFTPADLHPVAAESMAGILRSRLRSVLCIVQFRTTDRSAGQSTEALGCPSQFAQTFPVRKRGLPVSAFSWLKTDLRCGVELDLRAVSMSLCLNPRELARQWVELEEAFGIQRRAEDDRFRFYICPHLVWPGQQIIPERNGPLEGWREELAHHLREGEAEWMCVRRGIWDFLGAHGPTVRAEMSKQTESASGMAIGMWIFPPEVFQYGIDLSACRPGLLLFEL